MQANCINAFEIKEKQNTLKEKLIKNFGRGCGWPFITFSVLQLINILKRSTKG